MFFVEKNAFAGLRSLAGNCLPLQGRQEKSVAASGTEDDMWTPVQKDNSWQEFADFQAMYPASDYTVDDMADLTEFEKMVVLSNQLTSGPNAPYTSSKFMQLYKAFMGKGDGVTFAGAQSTDPRQVLPALFRWLKANQEQQLEQAVQAAHG